MDQEPQTQNPYAAQPSPLADQDPHQPPAGQDPQLPPDAPGSSLYGMGITAQALRQLAAARKWAFFLAIMGFIGCAFMVLAGAFFGLWFGLLNEYFPGGRMMGEGPAIGMALMYLVFAVVYFFPAFFLMRFSLQTKGALATHSPDLITDALRYLKLFFTYVGILVIVGMALSVVGILLAMVVAYFIPMPVFSGM